MRFFYLTFAACAALVAAAQKANPFNIPQDGYTFSAGKPTTLTWNPTTDGTVTLRLQWGAVLEPNGGTTIAGSISNSGSFTWTPPSSLAAQPDYTIEIIDDSNSNQVNYLPRFTVLGATGAATTSTAAKTTSTEASSTTEQSTTEEKTTSASTKTHTTLSSMTSPSSSAATTTTESASATETASQTTTGNASGTSASAAETTVPNTNAGMANRVSGGMLAVILGAVAVL